MLSKKSICTKAYFCVSEKREQLLCLTVRRLYLFKVFLSSSFSTFVINFSLCVAPLFSRPTLKKRLTQKYAFVQEGRVYERCFRILFCIFSRVATIRRPLPRPSRLLASCLWFYAVADGSFFFLSVERRQSNARPIL